MFFFSFKNKIYFSGTLDDPSHAQMTHSLTHLREKERERASDRKCGRERERKIGRRDVQIEKGTGIKVSCYREDKNN